MLRIEFKKKFLVKLIFFDVCFHSFFVELHHCSLQPSPKPFGDRNGLAWCPAGVKSNMMAHRTPYAYTHQVLPVLVLVVRALDYREVVEVIPQGGGHGEIRAPSGNSSGMHRERIFTCNILCLPLKPSSGSGLGFWRWLTPYINPPRETFRKWMHPKF